MKFMNTLIDKLQTLLHPIGNKVANQKHLQAISSGVISTLPLTFIGAIFLLIGNPAVTPDLAQNMGFLQGFFDGWYNFSITYKEYLMTPYNLTMNIFSLVVTFGVAYNLAKSYKMNPLTSAVLAVCSFLMVAAPFSSVEGMTVINTKNLGTSGLFAAMIIALTSVEISNFCMKKKFVLKLPDSVPPNVSSSFTAIIPLFMNILIIYGCNIILMETAGKDLIDTIMMLLTPAIGGINSLPGILFLIMFALLLWFFGIHGMNIMFSIVAPIFMMDIANNVELVAAGKAAILTPAMIAYYYAVSGGSGATIGLSAMMARSKSERLRAIGRIAIVPNLFSINEPVIFGTPIILNPLLFIPFVLAPLINVVLTYIAGSLGILPGFMMYLGGFFPIGVAESIISLSVVPLFWCIFMVIVSSFIWFPFFKVYEKQCLEEEQKIIE